MAVPESQAARVKMPVSQVATAAYGAVFGRLGLLLELAWLPLLILLAVELVPGLVADYLWPTSPASAPGRLDVAELVETVAALLCLNAFAVRWYQATLSRGQRAPPRRLFVAAWVRFVGYGLVLYVPIMAPMTALSLWGKSSVGDEAMQLLTTAVAAVLIVALLAVARVSLVFPAVAYGAPTSLLAAWRQMRGNTWRLIAATLLVGAPVFIIVSLMLSGILGAANLKLDQLPQPPPLGLSLLSGVVEVVLNFLFIALGASITAEFYRRIVLDAPNHGRRHR
ncbi:MAG TPA: hypothetical protein VF502_04385 [Stellaceae bacterium]